MKTLLLILLASIAAILTGCSSTERPGEHWRPPGMMMQNQQEKGDA